LSTGYCGDPPDAPRQFGTWVYAIVAIGILGIMIGALSSLFYVHQKNRLVEHETRRQYWQEQENFRQNILQMREQARASLLSLPWQSGSQRGSYRDDYASDNGSQVPIFKGSGLRNGFGDSEEFDDMENLVSAPPEEDSTQRRRKMSKARNGGRI